MSAKKRFYKEVTTIKAEDGYGVQLDGRDLRSPAGTLLIVPTSALAHEITDEWATQGDEITATTMPIFSLAVTVLDRVDTQREMLVDEMAGYGANDLLCYRQNPDEEPKIGMKIEDLADLSARQNKVWTPWLNWAEAELGAPLVLATGIMPVTQPDASVAALRSAVEAHDNWELGMLHRAVAIGGSLVLGLAFVRGHMNANALYETALLDELWQNEKWGSDWEAEDRRATILADFGDASRFLALKNGNRNEADG